MIPLRRLPLLLALFAAALCALGAGVAVAAGPGDLDPSFDGDGEVVLPYAVRPAQVLAQADGKVVLTDSDSSAVVRLNADGTPDRGFSGDGVATVTLGSGANIGAAALQPDGKIVVAGQSDANSVIVARFTQ